MILDKYRGAERYHRQKLLNQYDKEQMFKYGVRCPKCVEDGVKTPRVLLHGQVCKAHAYKDPRVFTYQMKQERIRAICEAKI